MVEIHRVRPIDGPVDAVVEVPGSKSIANRALVCAALADGTSRLANLPDGDDTAAMLSCLRALGLEAEPPTGPGEVVTITGTGGNWASEPHTLHAGLAGTTSRFVTALAALGTTPITIDGAPPLRHRPFGPLQEALLQLGTTVQPGESFGHLPVTITGPPTSGVVSIRGDVSSQYVSALMLIGPHLPGGLHLELTGPLVSRPYVEMTATVMSWFGVDGVAVDDQLVTVPNATYLSAEIEIEPDASSASYPLAIAAVSGGSVEVAGLGRGALQGDARFVDLLAEMGCDVEWLDSSVKVVRTRRLRGITVDMADISDLVPTVAVVAAIAETPTRIRGVGFIRAKESDRLGDLTRELRSAGVDLDETVDGLDIRPSTASLRAARLATHHDHRLAMAFGVLGTLVDGIDIEEPSVVSKSWPGFWTMLADSFR